LNQKTPVFGNRSLRLISMNFNNKCGLHGVISFLFRTSHFAAYARNLDVHRVLKADFNTTIQIPAFAGMTFDLTSLPDSLNTLVAMAGLTK
jgi:hypothetical protein